MPLVSRLAAFISVTSLELEEMNQKLEFANEKLKNYIDIHVVLPRTVVR